MNTYRFFSNLCLGFLLLCSISILSAQQVDFISYPDERTVRLPPEAQQRLAAIKVRPTSISVRLIQFQNLTTLSSQQQLRIPIPGLGQLVVTATKIEQPDTSKVFWSGVLQDNRSPLFFTVVNGDVTGMIHTERAVFSIEPLGAGHHVLIALDQSKFGPDDPPDASSKISPDKNHGVQVPEMQPSKSFSEALTTVGPVIDLLVAYTPAVASASGNISSLIGACIDVTKLTLTNSNVNADVALVHSVQVSYTESGFTNIDVNRLQGTSDGYMDNVHALRDQYGADIVVLLIAYADFLGQAYGIEVSASGAFCVVEDNPAVGNYTFPHEIGHLVGDRHDNDPTPGYNHGYVYAPAYWRTVMAVPYSGINRIPYWSNPNKIYGGVPMGTTCCNDNARKWNERASTVAGFRTPISVTITGPDVLEPYQTGTWTANPNPPGSYAFEWRFRLDGGSWSQVVGIAQTYSKSDNQNFELEVKVTGPGQLAYDYHYVTVGGMPKMSVDGFKERNTAMPAHFEVLQNFPNPFNPETAIRFGLPKDERVQLQIIDLLGREVRKLADSDFSAGYHSVVWDGKDNAGNIVPSGVYIYQIVAGTFRDWKKLALVR
ncbi:MAG: M12 family metallo-peptidase [bacterium]